MFSIENDIVYSIEYIDRSNWLVKKIPVMDKETFIKCFKEWITPGTKTEEKREQAEWVVENNNYNRCDNCNYFAMRRYNYCPKCGKRMKNGEMYDE